MKIPDIDWSYTPAEAIAEQRRLASQIRLQDDFGPLTMIAGVDVGFEAQGRITRAAVVLLGYPDMHVIERQLARCPTTMPYIPGLLSFRELPAVLQAMQQLQQLPDLLLCDGQGYAHPRRMGVASHLGLLLDMPSIGIGKSRLVGHYEEPGVEKGEWSPLWDRDEQIGVVLRSRTGVSPLFVSPGHRVAINTARQITLDCLGHYRLPEPIRAAHHLASLEKEV